MTLGTALIIIAILYLIDKHKLWKRCAQGVMVLAVAAAVADTIYEVSRDRARVAVNKCLRDSTPAGNKQAADEHRVWCEQHPEQPLIIDMSTAQPLPNERKVTQAEYDDCIRHGCTVPH
jgi:hypothetical protein